MRFTSGIKLVEIKCPYFKSETLKCLNCEGIHWGTQRTSVWFEEEEDKEDYQRLNCFSYPNECELAKMIEKKYE